MPKVTTALKNLIKRIEAGYPATRKQYPINYELALEKIEQRKSKKLMKDVRKDLNEKGIKV